MITYQNVVSVEKQINHILFIIFINFSKKSLKKAMVLIARALSMSVTQRLVLLVLEMI